MELMLGWNIVNRTAGTLKYLYVKSALTVYDFKFRDYIRQTGDVNSDFSGNELTGTPPLSFATWISAETGKLSVDLNYQYVSDIPLNDANTVYSDAYHLVQLSLNWNVWNINNWHFQVFGGIDNLLDRTYSLGNDLNAFGGRSFNPAASRNFLAGIRVNFADNQ